MKTTIYNLKKQMYKYLHGLNLDREEKKFIINHFLTAELMGKATHGVGKFCWESQYFKNRGGKPFIKKDNKTTVLIDANREIGPLAAKFAVEVLIERAKEYGIALVGMKNAQRYGSLLTWANMIVDKDLIGLVMNTSEPLVPHPDGITAVLGTNPLGIGIPSTNQSILVDMATSKEPMGLTWQVIREEKALPKNNFYDKYGHYTTDPRLAKTVEVFGGYKGFALSLFVQILSTSLLATTNKINDKFDIGYIFIAINPSIFASLTQFKKSVSDKIKEVKTSKKRGGIKEIFLPGEHAQYIKNRKEKKQYVIIPDSVWETLEEKHI